MAADQGMGADGGYTVLVVEDEATHQMLIRRALTRPESAFSVVEFARESEEALRFARQMSFDVLLVDNRIPGTRGLDLLSEMRQDGVTSPFVLMTSAGSEDLVVQAYRQQVDGYVIKDSGFWKELPQVLVRAIRADQAKRREQALRDRLERTNAKLDAIQGATARTQQELKGELEALATAVDALAADARALVMPHLTRLQQLLP